jgi:hypothetical protein
MKSHFVRALVLALPFAALACTGGSGDDGSQAGDQDIKHVDGVSEGLTCGGLAGLACQVGLVCQMSGPAHPDQSGVCTKPPPPAQCQAIPACAPGTESVPSCDVKDKTCTSTTLCGHTIFCAQPQIQCQAIPACSGGDVPVDSCDPSDKDCAPLTMCGRTIFCTKPKVQCQAFPACGPGEQSVDKCAAGDKECDTISLCGHTIFCTKSK